MREIKFRIWHKETQQFFYSSDKPFSFESNSDSGYYIKRTNAHIQGKLGRFFNISNADIETIQQFTGLKDKNGKEVYEGDIVKFCIRGHTHGPEREENCGGEVWYNEKEAMFCFGRFHVPEYKHQSGFVREAYDWWYSATDDIDWNTFEVIGNIFENPELVKK